MTHGSGAGSRARPGRLRARHRSEMVQSVLDAAVGLVAADGEAALTMQRLAADLEWSVGTIYRYFPSKSDLVAAVRRQRLDAIFDAWVADGSVGATTAPASSWPVAALVPVVAAARFWISAARTSPREVELVRQVVADADPLAPADLGDRDWSRFVIALASVLDAAAGAGALSRGDAGARAVLVLLVVPAPDVADALGHLRDDPGGLDQLGARILDCLLLAWGADPDELAEARDLVCGHDERERAGPS